PHPRKDSHVRRRSLVPALRLRTAHAPRRRPTAPRLTTRSTPPTQPPPAKIVGGRWSAEYFPPIARPGRARASFPAMMDASRRPDPRRATAIAGLLVAAGLIGFALSDLGDLFTALTGILAFCAIGAELVAARYSASLTVSAAFVAGMLSVGFLG